MARAPKEKAPKRDYVQEVADRVIEQLQQGTAPWQKPWEAGARHMPHNPTTGKDYRGMNTIWLMMQGREDPRWLTYRQAEAAGAQVRKGEKGTLVQYWMWREERPLTDDAGRPVLDDQGKPRKVSVELERPRVMSSVVFNAEQIDGLPEREIRAVASEFERHERAEKLLAASPAPIRHVDGDSAHYNSRKDEIVLPLPSQFVSPDRYYATALHEIGHSTGHKDRLDRDLAHPFGSVGYAKEELRAEIASLMLGEELGLGHDPGQHVAYVASWIKVLQDDPREIFRAASDAEKILKFMLELERERELARTDEVARGIEAFAAPDLADAQALSEQIRSADWAHDFSDDAQVRQRAYDRIVTLQGEAAAFAARSPRHAELLSAVADAERSDAGGLQGDWYVQPDNRADATLGSVRGPSEKQFLARSLGWSAPAAPDRGAIQETPMNTSEVRVNLTVAYADKEQAKAAGARWDKEGKTWYAPPGADLDKLGRWRGSDAPARSAEREAPEVEFKRALQANGLVIAAKDLPIMDGRIHRVPVEGDKKGARSGSYKGFRDGHPAGYIENFLAGTKTNWKSEQRSASISRDEFERLNAEAATRRAEMAVAQAAQYERAGAAVAARLNASPDAPADHPYLASKGVEAYGVKLMQGEPLLMPPGDPEPMRFGGEGQLLVPVRDIDGKVWGAQSIGENGRKSFPRGSKLAGGFHMIGNPEKAAMILVAEGYATAAQLHRDTGFPVAVAFNANNLEPVALALKGRYPEHGMMVAGDNDHIKEAQGKANVGRERAEAAAKAVGGVALIPRFEPGEKGSDWNDLGQAKGKDTVLAQIGDTLAIASRHQTRDRIRSEREAQELAAARERRPGRERQREAPPREREPALTR